MLDTLLIAFREGLEAFLIVALTLSYLERTQRRSLFPAVYAGIGVALALSLGVGVWVGEEAAENPAVEGGMSLVAGLLVASMTVYVMKTARTIKADIGRRVERQASKPALAALVGLFTFTVLMIAREGIETAVMLGALSAEAGGAEMVAGGLAGVALTALIGVLWVRESHHINLRLFMQVSGVFLILFALRLFVYGVHELSEIDLIPYVDNGPIHIATEPFGHDGIPAQIMSYGLLVVPCAWILVAALRARLTQAA